MGRNHRIGRVSEEIKKSISKLLVNGIKDPRLNSRIITISGVDVTADGSFATVYITPLTLADEDKEAVNKEVLEAFNRAKGTFKKNIGKDITQSFKTIVGGELKAYNEMMNDARALATKRMVQEAEGLGADAVVNIRYASSAIMQGAAEVIAYGTAVKFV